MYKTVLVNKNNNIKKSYLDKVKLVKTLNINNEEILLEEQTYQAYLKFKEFLASKNIIIGISSAYRSFSEQESIYIEFKNLYGEEYANKIVAPIGASEHHTGLAIDLTVFIDNHFLENNEELFHHLDILETIHKYLSEFGFILRYPKDKEDITKYPYEPWHIRYVGKFVASMLTKLNYTLEEYLEKFSGILIVNKEKGMTSFAVVKEISNLFGIKKVGHTGTLDPLAEGVLIVAIGKATKIVELLTAKDKEYLASVKLGIKTDTLDITGKIIATKEIPNNLDLNKVLPKFKKTYLQEVPIYSAKKVAGKKLYEYARQNKIVDIPKTEVTIKEISLISKTKNSFTFQALVSKGCYIRSLIADICQELNTVGTMQKLIRIKQGNISINQANTLQEIKNNNFTLLKIADVLDYPQIIVDNNLKLKIKNGIYLKNNWNIKDKVIFKDKNDNLLGIYELQDNILKVWKNF